MTEALNLVREELGSDAVILDNKQIQQPDGTSFFEIKAAIDLDNTGQINLTDGNSYSTSKTDILSIQNQINEINNFLSLLVSTKNHFVNLYQHRPLAEIYNYLLTQGLDEKKVYLLMAKSSKLIGKNFNSKSRIVAAFCKQLINNITTLNPFEQPVRGKNTPPMYTFIGPTGVGKTTTLAKLAARLKIRSGYKVGIISLDIYRIGAYEQIKTYAEIIDVPIMSAQNRDELEFARRQLKECDFLLVDTIGRNFFNKKNITELLDFFSNVKDTNHLLVLSATSKDKDLHKLIQLFAPFKISGLIFTKLDETTSYGNIVNQLLRFPYPATFFCRGQKVPEDIEEATYQKIVRLIFPAKKQSGYLIGETFR